MLLDTIFAHIFGPFSINFVTFLTPPFPFMFIFLMFLPFYALATLMNRQQEHHSIVQLVTNNSIYLATDILKQSCSPS